MPTLDLSGDGAMTVTTDAPTPTYDALVAELGNPCAYLMDEEEPETTVEPPASPAERPAAKKAYPAPPEP